MERVIVVEPREGDVYLANGEGPRAVAIHMDVIASLFDIVSANPMIAEHLFEFIIELARNLNHRASMEG